MHRSLIAAVGLALLLSALTAGPAHAGIDRVGTGIRDGTSNAVPDGASGIIAILIG